VNAPRRVLKKQTYMAVSQHLGLFDTCPGDAKALRMAPD